jgi:hypothetical protein
MAMYRASKDTNVRLASRLIEQEMIERIIPTSKDCSQMIWIALLRAGFAQLIDIALRKSTLVLLWKHLFEANGITLAITYIRLHKSIL